jgi:hypothetical protein
MLRSAQFWLELHGTFGQRAAALWLLFGCILTLAMVSFALRRYGLSGAVRRCALDLQLDWRNLAEGPPDHQLIFAQRWGFWYVILGSVNMLVLSLSAACSDRDPHPIYIELVIIVFVLAALSPVAMYVDGRVDTRRFRHLAEDHPLLARLLSHRGSGLKPLPSSHRRRCKRLFCVLR